MRGDWIAAVAARLLRGETYRLTAAPAIADLQHESASRSLPARARDYAVIWLIVARALSRDLQDDAAAIALSDAARTVWPRVLGLYALIFLIGTGRRLVQGIRLHTPDMAPGEFRALPLPHAGDGLEPYLAGVLVSMAGICLAYAAAPVVFMFCRRQVRSRAIVIGALGLALIAYSTARLTRSIQSVSSDYTTAAIMRGTGWYPAEEPLAAIVTEELRSRRERHARLSGARPEAWSRAHAHWIELSRGLGVVVYGLVGAAIARGVGVGVLLRFGGIIGAAFTLRLLLPYVSLLLWPVYPATLEPFERVLREEQLAFTLLPLVACVVLALPVRRRTADYHAPA